VTDNHKLEKGVLYSDVVQRLGTVQKFGFHFISALTSLPDKPGMSQI
jgi:hypothetical protein